MAFANHYHNRVVGIICYRQKGGRRLRALEPHDCFDRHFLCVPPRDGPAWAMGAGRQRLRMEGRSQAETSEG